MDDDILETGILDIAGGLGVVRGWVGGFAGWEGRYGEYDCMGRGRVEEVDGGRG